MTSKPSYLTRSLVPQRSFHSRTVFCFCSSLFLPNNSRVQTFTGSPAPVTCLHNVTLAPSRQLSLQVTGSGADRAISIVKPNCAITLNIAASSFITGHLTTSCSSSGKPACPGLPCLEDDFASLVRTSGPPDHSAPIMRLTRRFCVGQNL